MIGYGLLNSKIQEFCLGGIINSFLNRSVIYLYPCYINYGIKNNKEKQEIIDSLYDIFIQEEIRLSPRLFKNFETFKKEWEEKIDPKSFSEKDITYAYYITDDTKRIVEAQYDSKGYNTSVTLTDNNFDKLPDIIMKYILSANVVQDKDYKFSSKNIEQTKTDGKENLKNLFKKVFEEYYYGIYFGGTKQKINPIQNWPKYYESIKTLVYGLFIYLYSNVIDKNDLSGVFQDWWNSGGNDFINSLSILLNAINPDNISQTDDVQKLKLFNNAIEKFKEARKNVPNFIDRLDNKTPTSDPYITTISDENLIFPLDANEKPININLSWAEFEADGDIAFKKLLDYLWSVLDSYYMQVIKSAGNEFSLNTIFDKANDYIKFIIQNITPSDNVETTINNLSTYFVKQQGYLKNLNKILSFYKSKDLLKERSYYLRILTEQINSLQEQKVDEYEKYIGI